MSVTREGVLEWLITGSYPKSACCTVIVLSKLGGEGGGVVTLPY